MTKRAIMKSSIFKKVKIKCVDGAEYIGKVKTYETPYDNDCDEGSICLFTDDGKVLGFMESDIETIDILGS